MKGHQYYSSSNSVWLTAAAFNNTNADLQETNFLSNHTHQLPLSTSSIETLFKEKLKPSISDFQLFFLRKYVEIKKKYHSNVYVFLLDII